ncbi:MAG: CARDB domain-containing protein [Acidobacteriota bacterium]
MKQTLTLAIRAAVCAGLAAAPVSTAAGRQPDLTVDLAGVPAAALPGADIGGHIRLIVKNVGQAPAPGTVNHPVAYMVDLTLGRDQVVPPGFRNFSPNFAEDVLVAGGRVSRTVDLAPGAFHQYPVGAKIPNDTPPGAYFLCATVDPGAAVAESHEENNTTCRPIRIQPRVNIGPQDDIPFKNK